MLDVAHPGVRSQPHLDSSLRMVTVMEPFVMSLGQSMYPWSQRP
jgi:hypothetical protein